MENRQTEGPVCRGLDPGLFFPDLDDPECDVTAALAACSACSAKSDCLAGALARNEGAGIWAGIIVEVAVDELAEARAARATGDGHRLVTAIEEAIAATDRYVTGETVEWPWVEAHDCARCGTKIEAGNHPPDQAGPKATCGLVSTYNKGCRCWKCRKGKSRYHAKSRG